ncbi:unnamed protein product [Tilletia laevis]|uniref:AMMECR1 domain-containing protein n=3 Tax=Tilletia TaxID=13289 RepID=A0A8X7MJX0_9BASI|nr:hypothetical protein CF336_g8938 [Tilletia laevis]KAE8182002.1 hypothetical protein CF328_g8661 [Tilletia controversa]KAE8240178.1 hypothetical protein A4X03_0g8582 [Tilletia caries]KAE8182406.1 hypothetical protein CF335_g8635 [Tilletia laevis]KAE8238606.1 hypothetical protein A4X06_0g8694 [Tilletia controversa]
MAPDGQTERQSATEDGSSSAKKASTSSGAVQPEHCYYCFDVLDAQIHAGSRANGYRNSSSRASSSAAADAQAHFDNGDQEFPLFVTWNIYPSTGLLASKRKSGARLRGCIGTFSPLPLAEGLRDYALTSALHDTRFSPIRADELPRLECGVSLLTEFEECDDYLDWEVGTHGIYIYLPNPHKGSSRSTLTATYLPDVIPEQGWSKTEAIDSAIQKAGWNGTVDEAMRRSLRVRRYQSEKIACSYDDWQAWKTDA